MVEEKAQARNLLAQYEEGRGWGMIHINLMKSRSAIDLIFDLLNDVAGILIARWIIVKFVDHIQVHKA
jgi:hypothetical protein